jgi:hypothetical protein
MIVHSRRRGQALGEPAVRVRVQGVNTARKRLADGSVAVYFYHRASGRRLQGQPNTPEFLLSLAEAERSLAQRDRATLAGLIPSL